MFEAGGRSRLSTGASGCPLRADMMTVGLNQPLGLGPSLDEAHVVVR
jgi:hypothetical protein